MSQRSLDEVLLSAVKQRLGTHEEAWLAGIRLRQGEPLWIRFQRHYERLAELPRRTRRRLQRRLALSLGALALMLALSGAPAMGLPSAIASGDTRPAVGETGRGAGRLGHGRAGQIAEEWRQLTGAPVLPGAPAATIVVDGVCTLPDAIMAANTDTATGNCSAGSGADVIDIQVDVNLTAPAPTVYSEMTIEGNDHTIAGDGSFGPLLSVNASGDMTLNNATITGGNNAGLNGGGIYVSEGSAEINESTVSNNYAYYGGGIANTDGGSLAVNNSVISGNSGDTGAGITNYFANATIDGSSISNNVSEYWGGGIRNVGDSTMTLSNSTVSGNNGIGAAGISNPSDVLYTGAPYLRIENSTIADNPAAYYIGGIDNPSIDSELVIVNSTISGNSAGSGAGALENGYYGPASVQISDSTITGNDAHLGGGIWNHYGKIAIARSVISGNSAAEAGSDILNDAAIVADEYNLFGHDGLTTAEALVGFTPGATDILATSDGTLPTALTTILDTNLADNGGPTETHALPDMFSPAVNGALVGCAAGDVDQRGYPRAMGPGMGGPLCDIGAFELQGAPPTDVSLSSFGGDAGGAGFLPGVAAAILAGIAALGLAFRRRSHSR